MGQQTLHLELGCLRNLGEEVVRIRERQTGTPVGEQQIRVEQP